jgi:hypothetical protein
VHLLSNYHGTETTTIKHIQKDGRRIDVEAPAVVQAYNSHMGGVDKADMLWSLYDRNKTSKKWWQRLFFAMIGIALVNSFMPYSEQYGKISVLDFKRRVTQGLLTRGRISAKEQDQSKIHLLPHAQLLHLQR